MSRLPCQSLHEYSKDPGPEGLPDHISPVFALRCRFTAVIWRKLKILRTTPALFLSALHAESHGGIFPLQAHPVIFNINGKSFHKRADFGCRHNHAQNVVLLFIAKRTPLPGKLLKDNGPLFFSGNSEQL